MELLRFFKGILRWVFFFPDQILRYGISKVFPVQPDQSSSLTHLSGWPSSVFEHFIGPSWASHCLGNNFWCWLPVDGSLRHQPDAGWWHYKPLKKERKEKFVFTFFKQVQRYLALPTLSQARKACVLSLALATLLVGIPEKRELVLDFEWYSRLDWLDGWVWCCMQCTLIVILLPQKQWGSRLV